MTPLLSIIIPTKDRLNILIETLNYVAEATKNINSEIIIVNDSKTNKIELPSKFKNFILLNNPKNGVASARNYGSLNSKGELILFLDDDMLISEGVLTKLISKTKENSKSIFLPNWTYPLITKENLNKTKFGRFLNSIEYTSLNGWLQITDLEENEIYKHNGIASYCLMFKRKDFDMLGGYNENFPYAGFEDYDFSARIVKEKFDIYILPNLIIYHNETDRINLIDWLNRKRRNATTQRKAVDLGYTELRIKYSKLKLVYLLGLEKTNSLLLLLCENIPNSTFLDPLYSFVSKRLISLYIYLGYKIDYDKYKGQNI